MMFAHLIPARLLALAGAVLATLAAFFAAYRSGKSAARNETAAERAAATERMLDAATAAPKDRDHVAKDLRSGRF